MRFCKQSFLESSKEYFEGVFEMIDEDLPDGAWFQMHVDTAEALIDGFCEMSEMEPPKDIDGFDITNYYLANKQ